MAYSDGLMLLGLDTTPVEVEAVASVVKTYRFPFPAQVEGFGLIVTEDFVAQATDPVFSLDVNPLGGAAVEKTTLTIGTALKFGNGLKAAQTAITSETEIDVGDVIMDNSNKLPFKLAAGDSLIVRHKTAGAAGGAVVPVVLIRAAGYDLTSAGVLS